MANIIKPKRKYTAGKPSVDDLEEGEIAINYADKKIYGKDDAGNIVELSNGIDAFFAEKIVAGAGDNSVELSNNNIDLYANKGASDQLKIMMNVYDDGSAFSIEPWKGDSTIYDKRLIWKEDTGWNLNSIPISTITTFAYSQGSIDASLLNSVNIFGVTDGVTVRDFFSRGNIIADSRGYGVLNISFWYLLENFGTVSLPTDTSITARFNMLEILKDPLGLESFEEYSNEGGVVEFEGDLPLANTFVSVYDTGEVNFWNRDFGDIANGPNRDNLDVTTLRCRASLRIKIKRRV